MTSPVPGVTYPDPITWSPGEFLTAPKLRGDMFNIAAIYAAGARPVFLGVNTSNPVPTAGSATFIGIGTTAALNSWSVNTAPPGFSPAAYTIPLAGYWLLQSDVTFTIGAAAGNSKYTSGFLVAANGTLSGNIDGGAVPASTTTSAVIGVTDCDLFQFNTFANTGDFIQTYVFTNNTNVGTVRNAFYMFEWIGLPTSGLTSYTGPYGTTATPVAAVPFPSGPGTTITNGGGISAGATSMTVADATGMIPGGSLGLDYISGQLYKPVAEAVAITSVVGTTIGISATSYGHAQGAPVAVPVGSAFLNQQVRDQVNYLAYPPLVRAVQTAPQSIPTSAFPSGTQITSMSATYAPWGGFASNTFTVPHTGTYLVYGQVYYAGVGGTSFTFSAGIQQNAGTIQWGTRPRSNTTTTQSMCATVRRLLRLTVGDTIKLYGFQDSGSAMNTIASGATFSRLICVWRSF